MKSKSLFFALVLAAAAGFAHSAAAAEHHHHKLTDKIFAKKAAAGGLTEVELGKIAEQNGSSQDVKDFGAKMVTDHGKANDNLKAIAAKDNIAIPDKPNPDQQALIDKLSGQTGTAFDTAYIHAMVKAHIGDKALFTEEIATAANPDLKQFAQDTLSVITDHLSMIQGIAQTHGLASGHPAKMPAMGSMGSSATTNAGSSAESKSGPGPGSNANPAPVGSMP